jgi:hypothetical protein
MLSQMRAFLRIGFERKVIWYNTYLQTLWVSVRVFV